MKCQSVSCSVMSDSATPWTVDHGVPLSMEYSRQAYWRGLSLPSSGNLPNPGIEPGPPARQADTLLSEPPGKLAGCFSAAQCQALEGPCSLGSFSADQLAHGERLQ